MDTRVSGSVIEFRTLGGVSLTVRDASGSRAIRLSPKLLALLAYLAVECPLGHRRRDDLVGLFWPELDEDRARASLSQALYLLKRELGDAAVVTHGQEVVCVDTATVWCDAAEFDSALAAGRPRDSLALYEGPFLKGFHLSDSVEFEQWLGTVSERFHGQAIDAARLLARQSEAAGDHAEALRFAGRALELSPYDETTLRDLIRLFDALGERPLALRAYERFAERLRDELDVEPSPETTELVETVKLRTEGNHPTPDASVAAAPAAGVTAAPRVSVAAAPVLPDVQPVRGQLVPPRRPRRDPFWLGLAGGAVLATFAIAYLSRGGSVPLDPGRVLVGSVDNRTGDPALDLVGTSMMEGVVQFLSLMDFVTPIPAVSPDAGTRGIGAATLATSAAALRKSARSAGAGTVILGSVNQTGDSLSLRSQVVDVTSGQVVEAIEVQAASAFAIAEALDALGQRVAAAVGSRVDPRLADWGSRGDTKPSFEAYLQFVAGVESYFGSVGYRQPEGALECFERASRLDSTFYTPRIWAVIAHHYLGNAAVADSQAAELEGVSQQLPLRDRYVLEYSTATRAGRAAAALDAMLRAMLLSPDAEYMPLAVLAALDAGHPRKAVGWMTGADTATGWAAYWGGYSMSLAEGYHELGLHERELEPAHRSARDAPANIYLQYPEVRALAELGNPDLDARLAEILDRADSPYSRGQALCMAAGELNGHGHVVTGATVLDRCIQWDVDHLEVGGDGTRLRLGTSLVLAGRLIEARPHLLRLAETRSDNPHVMGPLGVLEAAAGNADEAARITAHLGGLEPPMPAWQHASLYWRAAIAARLGRQKEAVRLLQQTFAAGGRRPDEHDPFLEPLWDYAPFAALLEVSG